MESTATLGIFFGNRCFRSETSGALLFGRERGDVDDEELRGCIVVYRPSSTSSGYDRESSGFLYTSHIHGGSDSLVSLWLGT